MPPSETAVWFRGLEPFIHMVFRECSDHGPSDALRALPPHASASIMNAVAYRLTRRNAVADPAAGLSR